MAKRRNWTDEELMTICRVYIRMLVDEKTGVKFNKAKICRETLPKLENRSRGSFEMKMMNISACMVSLGYDHVKGYKPYGHAQKSISSHIALVWRDYTGSGIQSLCKAEA